MRLKTLVFVMALALAGSVCGDDGRARVDYSAAEFDFRTGAEAIVLAVHSAANMSKTSVLLYGDGRVEIQRNDRALERRITLEEMREVLSKAAAAGLAEWDADTIRAQQLRDWGKPFVTPVDSASVTVQLKLENYRRGPVNAAEVSKHIVTRSPAFAARHLPGIPQFSGVEAMLEWAGEQIRLADSEANR